jgi:hypothetical protein
MIREYSAYAVRKTLKNGICSLQTLNTPDVIVNADWIFQQRWKKVSAESDDPEGSSSSPFRFFEEVAQ